VKRDAAYWVQKARERERAHEYSTASILWLAAAELSRLGSRARAWLLLRHERCAERARRASVAKKAA